MRCFQLVFLVIMIAKFVYQSEFDADATCYLYSYTSNFIMDVGSIEVDECYIIDDGDNGSNKVCYHITCDADTGGLDVYPQGCTVGLSHNSERCNMCEFCNLQGDFNCDCTNILDEDAAGQQLDLCTGEGFDTISGTFDFLILFWNSNELVETPGTCFDAPPSTAFPVAPPTTDTMEPVRQPTLSPTSIQEATETTSAPIEEETTDPTTSPSEEDYTTSGGRGSLLAAFNSFCWTTSAILGMISVFFN